VARDPGVLSVPVALALDQVLQSATTSTLLEDALYFVLDGAFGKRHGRPWHTSSRKPGILAVKLKEAGTEGTVDFPLMSCWREIQLE